MWRTFRSRTVLPNVVGSQDSNAATRHAARVVLLNGRGEVLLLQGHDPDQPERKWWFTVGGGIDGIETPRQAAVREVAEETGITLVPGNLVGPICERLAVFDFAGGHYRQHEVFFGYQLAEVEVPLSQAGFSEVERRSVDDAQWFSRAQLASLALPLFPPQLLELMDWAEAWDGITRNIGLQFE